MHLNHLDIGKSPDHGRERYVTPFDDNYDDDDAYMRRKMSGPRNPDLGALNEDQRWHYWYLRREGKGQAAIDYILRCRRYNEEATNEHNQVQNG